MRVYNYVLVGEKPMEQESCFVKCDREGCDLEVAVGETIPKNNKRFCSQSCVRGDK